MLDVIMFIVWIAYLFTYCGYENASIHDDVSTVILCDTYTVFTNKLNREFDHNSQHR